ncbi:MAG: hypothetical protein VX293_02425 [Candidatus Latescibacterota bacterium]|nr:hypothetical protein [Candidatus Latescibacterota bacterium]
MARGGPGLILALVCCVQPLSAEEDKQWLTPRRAWGLALFGGSAVLLQKGWDFHQRADEFYALYRQASSERDAEDFFDRADNNDTKSQMSGLAATAFALAGWQLWSSGDERSEQQQYIVKSKLLGLEVEPRLELEEGRVGLRFKRRFF